jgi:hypothetical protein
MVRNCTCGGATGACVCTTRPFGDGPPRLQASAVQDLDRARVGAKPPEPSAYDRNRADYLVAALRRAGIAPPPPGARLTAAQLQILVSGQETTSAKINLRLLCHDAEIAPAGLR